MLTRPFDASDRDDFARVWTVSVASCKRETPTASTTATFVEIQHGCAHHRVAFMGCCRGPSGAEQRVHDGLLRKVRSRPAQHRTPTAENGDVVGDREGLAHLVRDQHRRVPLRHKRAQPAIEVLRFARRQHGRGLIEHEQACLASERLDDLQPLLGTDGEIRHARMRVELKACRGRDVADTSGGREPS